MPSAQIAPSPEGMEVTDLGSPRVGGSSMGMNDPVLSLKGMSPDFDKDGKVDEMEQKLYDEMVKADSDGDGQLSRGELIACITSVVREMRAMGEKKGEIPISSLNPDSDGDGKVEPWEMEVYSRIIAADADKAGTISVRELYEFIRAMSKEVEEAKGGIPIRTLNPDTDGDGKVEKWEVEVFERIKAADADASGSISVKELFGVIKGAAESDKQKRLFRRLFGVAVAIIFVLIGMMLVMGVVAGNAVKENHTKKVPGVGNAMTALDGSIVSVAEAVESHTIWNMPNYTTTELGQVTFLDIAVDMNTNPSVNDWTSAAFKPTGVYFKNDNEVVLSTPEGYEMHINGLAKTGYIVMGSNTYPISDKVPATRMRRLEEGDEQGMPSDPSLFPAIWNVSSGRRLDLSKRRAEQMSLVEMEEVAK